MVFYCGTGSVSTGSGDDGDETDGWKLLHRVSPLNNFIFGLLLFVRSEGNVRFSFDS